MGDVAAFMVVSSLKMNQRFLHAIGAGHDTVFAALLAGDPVVAGLKRSSCFWWNVYSLRSCRACAWFSPTRAMISRTSGSAAAPAADTEARMTSSFVRSSTSHIR